MAAWRLLLAAVLGYLLGNIQTGLIVGLVSRKIDLRTKGSGSTGTTNALRTLGLPSAIITFLGDLLKGLVASLLGAKIAGPNGQLLAALAVILGHIWPVFFGFAAAKALRRRLARFLSCIQHWAWCAFRSASCSLRLHAMSPLAT